MLRSNIKGGKHLLNFDYDLFAPQTAGEGGKTAEDDYDPP
jgi:hypothetical protein